MSSLRFAVIGNPIAHSLSPIIHRMFAKQTHLQITYEKIQGSEQNFEQQVSDFFNSDGKGLNITLPFKQKAFAMASEHSSRCITACAANTLWMNEGKLMADNTDGIGLVRDLTRYRPVADARILVLGAGGATRGILGPLLAAKPESIVLTNRTQQHAQELHFDFPQVKVVSLEQVTCAFDLVINATSASLHGQLIDLPDACWAHKPFCYDLVYQLDKVTTFVAHARSKACEATDGLGMLVEQAAESFCLWNDVLPVTEPVLNSLRLPKR